MNSYIVSPSPHIRSGRTTRKIMLDVILALCPGLIASTVIFGWRVLLVTAVCVGSCVLIEYLCRLVMKRDQTIGDLSAVVTGMLLAMNLPVSIPLWAAMIGSFFAIAVAKQLFGGIGQNFANPALTARILLLMSFSGLMTEKSVPLGYEAVDVIASATPLAQMAAGEGTPTLLQMFLGVKGSCAMGEVSCAAAGGDLSGDPAGHQADHTPSLYWNGVPVQRGPGDESSGPDPFRRVDAGGHLHGYRLRHYPHHQLGEGGLWPGMRHYHGADPAVRKLP